MDATSEVESIYTNSLMADDLSKITAQRMSIATLLTPKPADAVAWYFALEHEARRTKLFLKQDAQGRAIAFAAVCQTGLDLFRPLVVMRGDDSAALRALLKEALQARRQYLFNALPSNKPDLEAVAELHGDAIHAIYTLDRDALKPVVNILVQTSKTPDGLLRAAIKTRDGDNAAEAGTSWISSRYAEMYVKVIDAARNRGLGKSVVSAVSAQVLQAGRTPLYIVDPSNVASIRLAERLGYHNTNSFEISGALTPRA
jgi:GNAT superfamily N-acetyltransferase